MTIAKWTCLFEAGFAGEGASILTEALQIPEAEALGDQSFDQGIIETVEPNQDSKESHAMAEPVRYSRNPDVVLREEDQDGGLLFNSDTNQIRAVNETGLFVWKLCDGSRDLPTIETAIRESFRGVPEDQVSGQVTEFLDGMLAAGFIGTVAD